jgi:hypothetical protein
VERILFRHDKAPYLLDQIPDTIQGDVAIDRLELVNATTPIEPVSWARLKALYR